MIVLGLDPGTATTGYGVVEVKGNQLVHIEHGCILTPANSPLPQRLHQIALELRAIINKHHPVKVGVEEIFFSKNVSTAISVAQARGVLLQVCTEANIPVHSFTPVQVKQSLTSYGRADKKQMQKMICMVLGLVEVPTPDDAADALAIAVTCAHTNSFEKIEI